MTRSIRLIAVTGCLGLLAAGCVLRPVYRDLTSQAGDIEGPLRVVFIDADTAQPLPDMKVSWGEGRDRVVLTTDQDGAVIIPREPRFEQQNPIIVLDKPADVRHVTYEIGAAPMSENQGPAIMIPEGGAGPGQPPDRYRQEPSMSGSGTEAGQDTQAPADGGTTAL